MPGEIQHFTIKFEISNFGESFFRRAHFIIKIKSGSDQTVSKRANEKLSRTPKQDRFGDSGDLFRSHTFPDKCETFIIIAAGCQIKGPVKVNIVYFIAFDKSKYIKCLIAFRNSSGNFFLVKAY